MSELTDKLAPYEERLGELSEDFVLQHLIDDGLLGSDLVEEAKRRIALVEFSRACPLNGCAYLHAMQRAGIDYDTPTRTAVELIAAQREALAVS